MCLLFWTLHGAFSFQGIPFVLLLLSKNSYISLRTNYLTVVTYIRTVTSFSEPVQGKASPLSPSLHATPSHGAAILDHATPPLLPMHASDLSSPCSPVVLPSLPSLFLHDCSPLPSPYGRRLGCFGETSSDGASPLKRLEGSRDPSGPPACYVCLQQ